MITTSGTSRGVLVSPPVRSTTGRSAEPPRGASRRSDHSRPVARAVPWGASSVPRRPCPLLLKELPARGPPMPRRGGARRRAGTSAMTAVVSTGQRGVSDSLGGRRTTPRRWRRSGVATPPCSLGADHRQADAGRQVRRERRQVLWRAVERGDAARLRGHDHPDAVGSRTPKLDDHRIDSTEVRSSEGVAGSVALAATQPPPRPGWRGSRRRARRRRPGRSGRRWRPGASRRRWRGRSRPRGARAAARTAG